MNKVSTYLPTFTVNKVTDCVTCVVSDFFFVLLFFALTIYRLISLFTCLFVSLSCTSADSGMKFTRIRSCQWPRRGTKSKQRVHPSESKAD